MLEVASERLMWPQYYITVSINDQSCIYSCDVCKRDVSIGDVTLLSPADLWMDAPAALHDCMKDVLLTFRFCLCCWSVCLDVLAPPVWCCGPVKDDYRTEMRAADVLRFVWILRWRVWNCLMTSLSSCEENLELLTTQQVKHTFIKDGADQMTHPNDTAAAQNTLLYINFRGCNFLCKLRIPTEKENESLLSRITQKASVQTPSKELSGQLMNFCLFLPFL